MSSLHAAAIAVEARIPESRSLKAKRAVLRRVLARLESMRVAVSEVDHQNSWQRTTLGVAVVAPEAARLTQIVESVKRALYEDPRFEVLDVSISHLEMP